MTTATVRPRTRRSIRSVLAAFIADAAEYREAHDRFDDDDASTADYESAAERWSAAKARFCSAVTATGYDAVVADGNLWLALDWLNITDQVSWENDGKPLRVLNLDAERGDR